MDILGRWHVILVCFFTNTTIYECVARKILRIETGTSLFMSHSSQINDFHKNIQQPWWHTPLSIKINSWIKSPWLLWKSLFSLTWMGKFTIMAGEYSFFGRVCLSLAGAYMAAALKQKNFNLPIYTACSSIATDQQHRFFPTSNNLVKIP